MALGGFSVLYDESREEDEKEGKPTHEAVGREGTVDHGEAGNFEQVRLVHHLAISVCARCILAGGRWRAAAAGAMYGGSASPSAGGQKKDSGGR
jgi:hypothetical protein